MARSLQAASRSAAVKSSSRMTSTFGLSLLLLSITLPPLALQSKLLPLFSPGFPLQLFLLPNLAVPFPLPKLLLFFLLLLLAFPLLSRIRHIVQRAAQEL